MYVTLVHTKTVATNPLNPKPNEQPNPITNRSLRSLLCAKSPRQDVRKPQIRTSSGL